MADKETNFWKTLGALSALGKVLSFIEKVAIGGFFMLLQYAQMMRQKAENIAEFAKTELKVKEKQDELDKENEGKDGVDIIDDYLADKSDE